MMQKSLNNTAVFDAVNIHSGTCVYMEQHFLNFFSTPNDEIDLISVHVRVTAMTVDAVSRVVIFKELTAITTDDVNETVVDMTFVY